MARNNGRKCEIGQHVAGYVRVSSEKQATEGHSREAQETRIRAMTAARFPGSEVRLYFDTRSGRTTHRPGIRSIMAGVRAGEVSAVIACTWDRLFRSVGDCAEFLRLCESANVAVLVISSGIDTGTVYGRTAAKLAVIFAEHEVEVLAERVRIGHAHARLEGRKGPGFRPFGWRVTEAGLLEIDAEETKALEYLVARRARGAPWGELSAYLNSNGPKPVHARAWSPQSVRSCVETWIVRRDRGNGVESTG